LNLLEQVAVQLVSRVRDDDPEANARWLHTQLPNPTDWRNLAFVLAAAVPEDRTWRQLTAWTYSEDTTTRRFKRPLKPCGTLAAARRHRARGEPVDDACVEAERTYDRERRRAERRAA
jgi:ribosomal protein S21